MDAANENPATPKARRRKRQITVGKHLTQEKVKARETRALALFTADPDLSIPKANEQLKKEFGSAINTKNCYALRKIARTVAADRARQAAGSTGTAEALQSAARDPGSVPAGPAGRVQASVIPISGPQHASAVRETIERLAGMGMKVRAAHEQPSYIVVELAQ